MKHLHSHISRPAFLAGFVLTLFSLVLAACAPTSAAAQGPYGSIPTAPAGALPSGTPIVPVTGGGDVQVAQDPKLGQILVDSRGMTLYTFGADQPKVSNCVQSDCVAFWPIFTASAQPAAAAGIPGKLGLITRSDGKMQVTYNDMPLYYFALDKQPGDVKGDAIDEFGGVWHAVAVGGASGASSSGGNSGSSGSSGGYGGGY